MSSLYRQQILEHYKEPHNNGVIEDPDREASVDNPTCGDSLRFTARLDGDELVSVRFEGEGCALSVAAASMLTDELEGETMDEVKNISGEHMFELLGLDREAVSPMRHKCVLLARDAVQEMVA